MALSDTILDSAYALEVRGISKRFGPVKALDDVTMCVKKSTVHAVVGENGAGKSTLMKIIAGVYQPDSGVILRDGTPCVWKHPADSLAAGIAMIYQELSLAPDLTIAENVWLGKEPKGILPGVYSLRNVMAETNILAKKYGFAVDASQKVKDLSPSDCQIVEILKSLARNADILVMDEPTSSCGRIEAAALHEIVKKLSSNGTSIIYISHRLEEILAIAHYITVLRDGRVVYSGTSQGLGIRDIISYMVGRDLTEHYPKKNVQIGSVALSVSKLNSTALKDISIELHWGEVLGIAGLVGSGRTQLARAICGLEPILQGSIRIEGNPVEIRTPADALSCGIMYITEDRKRSGLCLDLPAAWNMTLPSLAQISPKHILHLAQENEITEKMAKKLSLKWGGPATPTWALSGGNQQKLLFARALIAQSRLLVLDEPTRGIDIAAKVDIYNLIGQMAAEGKAVLIMSSDLPELLGITDRIMVMRKGQLVGNLPSATATQEAIMELAAVDVPYA